MKKILCILATIACLGCTEHLGYDTLDDWKQDYLDVSELSDTHFIAYTTSDHTPLTIDKARFDANIIAHASIEVEGSYYFVIHFDKPITSIGAAAFRDCDGLTNITIPNSVTSIEVFAFYCCSSLTSITIPNSVTSIGEWAFYDCDGLTSITIPNSVTSIGEGAFSGCDGLTSITIPNSVTSIGNSAFHSCSKLKEFKGKFASSDGRCLIVDGVLNSFAPSGLTSYTIPNSVTSIGGWAFNNCSSLTSITIPDSVTEIGDGAFRVCYGLTSITIPDSVTEIGGWAFYNCNSLTSITIPNSVTSIGFRTFECCYDLTSVTIGNGVTSIGDGAFYDCDGLTSVYCTATTPPTLGGYVFDNNDSCRIIYVPTSSVSAYRSASYWSEYASSIVGYDF